MAKKITVAMLRDSKNVSVEEVMELMENLFGTITEKIEKADSVDALFKQSVGLDPDNEDDCKAIMALGTYLAWIMKMVCTPAAYKYLINSIKEAAQKVE